MKSTNIVSLAAALLSASCCVVPVVLLVIGFTSLGPFEILMRYRPITLSFSIAMLAASFYWVYRPGAEAECRAGVCSSQTLRRSRWIVWLSACMMAVFIIVSLLPLQVSM